MHSLEFKLADGYGWLERNRTGNLYCDSIPECQ